MLGTKAVSLMWAILVLGFLLIGVQHGKNLGDLKAIQEYERGFNDGKKYALYHRPVIEELEMVCVGLWTTTLPEQR